MIPSQKQAGRFTLLFYSTPFDPASFVDILLNCRTVEGKGRGGIGMMEAKGLRLVARKYRHGGILRAVTRDFFWSGNRVIDEASVLTYLRDRGFPVVSPFCAVIEQTLFGKRLYLVTRFEENTVNLLDYLATAGTRQRLKMVKTVAEHFWSLEQAGIYHPDLHLMNVMVTAGGKLVFLDFDRARKKLLGLKDVESMVWRLDRFVDKMGRQGKLAVQQREKTLFLRTYDRLSHRGLTTRMQSRAAAKTRLHRIGWFFESLLYGKQ